MVLDAKKPEADIEGAARDGDVIYWVSSHGTSRKGKRRASRLQFFGTRIIDGATLALEPVGKPYTRLLDDLDNFYPGADFNIEGLAMGPGGSVLLGLRSPVFDGRALVMRITNPREVLDGEPPVFSDESYLDLGGLGIRSIDRLGDGYLVAAGPSGDERTARLFLWDGAAGVTALPIELGDIMPEALVVRGRTVLMLSDDGSLRVGSKECKRTNSRRFRGRTVEIP